MDYSGARCVEGGEDRTHDRGTPHRRRRAQPRAAVASTATYDKVRSGSSRSSREIRILMTFRIVMIANLVALALVVAADPGYGGTLQVGPSQTYKAPSEAAAVAKNGDRIHIDARQ